MHVGGNNKPGIAYILLYAKNEAIFKKYIFSENACFLQKLAVLCNFCLFCLPFFTKII
jgi:hypothetical protein